MLERFRDPEDDDGPVIATFGDRTRSAVLVGSVLITIVLAVATLLSDRSTWSKVALSAAALLAVLGLPLSLRDLRRGRPSRR